MEMFLADVTGCDMRPRPIGESVPGGMAMSAPVGDVHGRVRAGKPAEEAFWATGLR